MKILKTKYYLHIWGRGELWRRPQMVVAHQFASRQEACDFLASHRPALNGYMPDTGRYIMDSVLGAAMVEFVEVE